MIDFVIRPDDLSGQQTRALLALHLAGMHENSPPEAVFALDISGLQAPEVMVWSAWDETGEEPRIASIGALKLLADGTAEVKSMRTHPAYLRKGAAGAILETVILGARERGIMRLSLETGRGAPFEPAIAMYRRRGFENGASFSEYAPNEFSQFLHLDL